MIPYEILHFAYTKHILFYECSFIFFLSNTNSFHSCSRNNHNITFYIKKHFFFSCSLINCSFIYVFKMLIKEVSTFTFLIFQLGKELNLTYVLLDNQVVWSKMEQCSMLLEAILFPVRVGIN